MQIRLLTESDIGQWVELRTRLWPDRSRAELEAEARALAGSERQWVVFVAEKSNVLAGFLELRLRSVAEGCNSSPVPYGEGWYVEADSRRRGIGRALMKAAEEWSRARGFTEMGSDANIANTLSWTVHRALGFEEVERLVIFRKPL